MQVTQSIARSLDGTTMAPKVSIIVNCFNQSQYLARSVQSVLAQTWTDLECLIVDDGSTDATPQVAAELVQSDPRVQYFRKENGGLPAARNFGVAQAQGDWIQCLDADDWIHADKIRAQLAQVENRVPQGLVIYCDYERVLLDAADQIVDRQPHAIGQLSSEALIQRLLLPDFLVNTPHPALQQCMLMHRSVLVLAKFPEQFKALGDRYFAIEILQQGAEFVHTPMVGAFYTKHQTNRTNNWAYMCSYYILFYETLAQQYPQRLSQCQAAIDLLINEAIQEKQTENFQRIVKMLTIPVHLKLWNQVFTVRQRWLLRVLYQLRCQTPNFILYEKYRGPRSQRVLKSLRLLKANS
ncbi:glycosyltransferase family 2 protein [Alkalinema pantanalense CENA528]|uniref:glycosyltransferase family 2 protein n=1 Tax=Alkalinema pantanalense TaxID=1620705 RepID=UPI003D6DB5DB